MSVKKKTIKKTRITSGQCSYIQLDAGHDINGNPRRGYLVIHSSRGILACCGEGYFDTAAMEFTFGPAAKYFTDLGRIKTTKSQLRELRKLYPDRDECPWELK